MLLGIVFTEAPVTHTPGIIIIRRLRIFFRKCESSAANNRLIINASSKL